LKGPAGKSDILSQYGPNNTGNNISSEKAVSMVRLKWLMEELCDDGQGEESSSFHSISLLFSFSHFCGTLQFMGTHRYYPGSMVLLQRSGDRI